ncbi:MAG: XRE family transcriptional regulator [Usitatibacteraceae bacterium]
MPNRKSSDDINTRIARRVSTLRATRKLTLDELAKRCDVSRSMISLIERGESSPTAIVLEKVATGLGVSLASLFEAEVADGKPVVRRNDQLSWRDPASGYVRRNISPPDFRSPIQIVEVDFPPRAKVAYESSTREVQVDQQIWVLDGAIDILWGDEVFALKEGDCLAMRLDRPTAFSNPHRKAARYVVVITSNPFANVANS